MAKRSFWQRVRDAFRTFTTEPIPETPAQDNTNVESGFSTRILPELGPDEHRVWLTDEDNDYVIYTTQQINGIYDDLNNDRKQVVDRIMGWFPRDVVWSVPLGRYVDNSNRTSRSPARFATVVVKAREFTDVEVDMILSSDRQWFQDMAHGHFTYWYH